MLGNREHVLVAERLRQLGESTNIRTTVSDAH
jgi:hypothetical protein